jgi:hypothetical protein
MQIAMFTLALSNVLVVFPPFGNIAPANAGAPLSTVMYGLDYSSADWSYSESESHLRKDFQLFRDNNITLICPWLHWSKIQPTSASVYDDGFLSRIKSLCEIAYEYGIYVDIDFHSGSGSSTEYGLPRWFRGTFDNVAKDSTQKTRWINMEKHVVTYLRDVVNIRSFHLFNEPWVPSTSLRAAYLDLFVDTANAIRALTTKPLTIRFGSSSFMDHGWSASTIYSFLDFVAINWYPSKGVTNLDDCVKVIRSHSRDVQISEYGYRRTAETTAKDSAQNTSIARQISLFQDRKINVTLICQFGMLVGEGWNIYNVAKGTPRPAFYTVARANEGRHEVLPPPDEDSGPPPAEPQPPTDNGDGTLPPSDFFEDDFSSSTFSNWNGTRVSSGESASVVNTLPYWGTFHAEFAATREHQVNYAYCYKILNETEVYARGYFNIPTKLPLENEGDRLYLIDLTATQESICGVGLRRYNNSDCWTLYGRNGSDWVGPIYATLPTIEANRWYCVEIHWKRDAVHGILETYVNGVKIFGVEALDTDFFGNVTEVHFGLLAMGIQQNFEVYGDWFAISDKRISLLSDINRDGWVDIVDVTPVALSFGSDLGDELWIPVADINRDQKIDILDAFVMGSEWSNGPS